MKAVFLLCGLILGLALRSRRPASRMPAAGLPILFNAALVQAQRATPGGTTELVTARRCVRYVPDRLHVCRRCGAPRLRHPLLPSMVQRAPYR